MSDIQLPGSSDVTVETEYTFAEGYRPTVTEIYATKGRTGEHIVTRVTIRESGAWHDVNILGTPVQKDGTVMNVTARSVYVAHEIEVDLWEQHQAKKS